MTSERWQKIQAAFHEATELQGAERTALLERLGAEDDDLRREVENLLRADSSPSLLLSSGPGELAAVLLDDDTDALDDEQLQTDTRIGPYRILRELGKGGMGAVFLAERADGQFTRQVAVKVVKRGIDTDEVLRRFRYEREILARLDHPNIARLLDGGATDDGLPYLVMEYVEGQRIDEYCDENRLPVEHRLRLFLTVCDAVRYAHRSLVVHRDLKPANILVTADGHVKLLDFGIAKLLDEDQGPLTSLHTQTGLRVMTPEYASPEQVRGDPITTAADVYSLGTLLYELLTGHRPFESIRRSFSAMDVDKWPDPSKPSTVVGKRVEAPGRQLDPASVSAVRATTSDRLARRLRGDLDTIALKALRTDPSERYPSADALYDDVRHHLEGRPVMARPVGLFYRVWKYANRHRTGVAVAAAFALLAVAFTVFYTVRVTHERDRAEQALETREAVTNFLAELFYAASPAEARGDTLNVFDLLDRGAARIDSELMDRPAVQAHLLHILSHVYGMLGNYDRSVDLAFKSLKVREDQLPDDGPAIAESANQLGSALHMRGEYEAALPHLQRAFEIRRRHFPAQSHEVAESALNLGLLLSYQGRYDEAEPHLREALEIDRGLHGDVHPTIATDLNNLAVLLYHRGEYSAAGEAFEEALEIRRQVYGEPHPRVALTMNNLAAILRRTGNLERAEALFRDGLAMTRTLHGGEHPDVASALSNLAVVLQEQGRSQEALSLLEEAVDLGARTLGEHPEQADALSNLGSVLYDLGRYVEAEQMFTKSLEMNLAVRGDAHPRTARSRYNLGRVAAARGDRTQAESLLRSALDLQVRALPEQHDETAMTRRALALLLMEDSDLTSSSGVEAESLLVRAERALEITYGESDERVVDVRELLRKIRQ